MDRDKPDRSDWFARVPPPPISPRIPRDKPNRSDWFGVGGALLVVGLVGWGVATWDAWSGPMAAGLGILLIVLLVVVGGILALGVYFMPGIVAFRRHHDQAGAILTLNLLLGWTGLGWALSLVWAMTN